MSTSFNPDFDPTGLEGGIDTNTVPWLTLPQAPGLGIDLREEIVERYRAGRGETISA